MKGIFNTLRMAGAAVASLVMIFTAVSCGNDASTLLRQASGKAGEVIVVCGKGYWEGDVGGAIRDLLAADYPSLPQREASFDLINVPDNMFTDMFRTHRNLVMVKISKDESEAKMGIRNDVWSTPQTIVTITAGSAEQAISLIKSDGEKLFNAIEQAERNRIIRSSKRYEEVSLRNTVTKMLGGSPYFPSGYSLKKMTDDFIWISYETSYTNQGFFAYRIDISDLVKHNAGGVPDITLEMLIAARNIILERNVPGMFEGTYMTTASGEEQAPSLKWMKYKGRDFGEIRGLWEVQNDFMGGPFVQHVFYDKDGQSLIVLEGFVYAPKYDKRNYLRQLEAILYSFEWEEEFNK